MNNRNIKVENTSDYWCNFEGEKSVYFHFIWNNAKSIDFLKFKGQEFIKEYIIIAKKYKIAVPINDLNYYNLDYDTFSDLYKEGNGHCFPTDLFVNQNSNPHNVISVNPVVNLQEGKTNSSQNYSSPLRVELLNKDSEVKLLCYLDNDVFNLWLDNKKTKSDPKIGGKGYCVNNSDLAYLNAPRLNSYLRDIKKLCSKFKMDDFKFENLGLEDFSQEGILFENEIIYYEDIFKILLPKYQIVNIETS
ncbi:hypothetical protein [Cellulophaga sp. Asnod2-G02]|uniref:hypothetical protein n=1 Tax=Cellulophaga sp. Asnod2-G02 TaxID=3160572 RepID=UPI0038686AB8